MSLDARRSLRDLLIGRICSAMIGLLATALLWRSATADRLGQFLAALAVLEVIALVSGLGLSSMVQRYGWPWVMGHEPDAQRPRLAGRLAGAVIGMLLLRGIVAALLAWMLVLLASPSRWALHDSGALQETLATPMALLAAWAAVGTVQRGVEELQLALMMQAVVQAAVIGSHVLRISALLMMPTPWIGIPSVGSSSGSWTVSQLIALDLSIGAVIAVVGLVFLMGSGQGVKGALPAWAEIRRGWGVGTGFWGVQLMGLPLGVPAFRLMVAAWGGPTLVAVHGAAQALVDVLRNAQPLVFLGSWLRPLLVRMQMQDPTGRDVRTFCSGMAQLNVLMLIPPLGVLTFGAAEALRWIGGQGILSEAQRMSLQWPNAPAAESVAAGLGMLAVLQGLHSLVSMRCAALEHPRAAWRATALSWLAIPLAMVLWPGLGLWAAVVALALAEGLWISVAWWGADGAPLTAQTAGSSGSLDTHTGTGRSAIRLAAVGGLTLAAVGAGDGVVRALVPAVDAHAHLQGLHLLGLLLLSSASMLLAARVLRPLTASQAMLMDRLLPAWTWRPWAERLSPRPAGVEAKKTIGAAR